MTETFKPVISMLSECASSGLTFQTMPPSSVMFHRVCAETQSADKRKIVADKMRGNFMRRILPDFASESKISILRNQFDDRTLKFLFARRRDSITHQCRAVNFLINAPRLGFAVGQVDFAQVVFFLRIEAARL